VERCEARKCAYLIYGKFIYRADNSLTAFKRRNGFEQVCIPRYYVPLTTKGRIALSLKAHQGILSIFPASMSRPVMTIRGWIAEWRYGRRADMKTRQVDS
jgi:hypothetical protein